MKTGIITGSSRGIGLATAGLLTDNEDYQIIGTSTSGNHTLIKDNFRCLALDLSNEESINHFLDHLGNVKIDFLVNNAGILLEKWDNPDVDMLQLRQTFEVNLFGTLALTEKLLPLFADHGHIINVTSAWGSFSEPGFDAIVPHYKMSKAALNMYTRLLAKRLESRNITVSSFDPGWTQTDMGGSDANRKPEAVAREIGNLLKGGVPSGQFWHREKIRAW